MKIKFSPVVSVFVLYLILGSYLIFTYFNLSQSLALIEIIDLAPIAYAVLTLAAILLTLSLFSLFRIPFFHYLFKMVHLWMLILAGLLWWLYHEYGYLLSEMFSADTQQSIAHAFPVTEPGMFQPLLDLSQHSLTRFREKYVYLLLAVAIVLGVLQVVLYLPSSLRYVYHTHISPLGYTIKHILVSVLLLAPLLLLANFLLKLDAGINPNLAGFLAKVPAEMQVSENAFYPLLTVWLSELDDKSAAGQQWFKEHQQMVAYFTKNNKLVKSREYPQYRKLNLSGMDKSDQAGINQLFVQRLSTHTPEQEKAVLSYAQRYQMPLQAMQKLRAYKQYQNPIDYLEDSHTEYFKDYSGSFLALHRLSLLVSLIGHATGDQVLIKHIMSDYSFNHMIIRNSSDPEVKLLHIKKQTITAELIYSLLQDPGFQNDGMYKLVNSMPALAGEVIDHSNIARKKVKLIKTQIDQGNEQAATLRAAAAYIFDYTFKYHKTLNCIYNDAVRTYNLDGKDPLAHIRSQASTNPKPGMDNLIGNIICLASIPASDSRYYTNAVEASGKLIILKARSKMLEQGIRDININAFLTNNSTYFYNPFTGGALNWDRDARQIFFEYNDGQAMVRISL